MGVLVTGGAGLLGSALPNHVAKSRHQVRMLDDLSAGDVSPLHPQVFFKRGDARDVSRLRPVCAT